jgi:hypothetical protein
VNPHDEIVEHQLNSPFVYLRSLVQDLSTSGNGEGGSEHVPLGAPKFDKTSQNSQNVEEFLAGLRFEQMGKLDMVPIDNIKLHN